LNNKGDTDGSILESFCGIGGDLFAIIWDAETKKLYGINSSGRSPASLTPTYFEENGIIRIPPYGPLPVTVPGCVDGWFEIHKKFGNLPMKTILAPAIQYAREGFPVSEVIAYAWKLNIPDRKNYPGFLETYIIDGKATVKGEIFRNPNLANTLEKIADQGRDIFYKGDIAHTIDAYMKRQGGFLSYQDLVGHQSQWVDPVSTNCRGYDVWELSPNGQGIAALQMLNLLEHMICRRLDLAVRNMSIISWRQKNWPKKTEQNIMPIHYSINYQ